MFQISMPADIVLVFLPMANHKRIKELTESFVLFGVIIESIGKDFFYPSLLFFRQEVFDYIVKVRD